MIRRVTSTGRAGAAPSRSPRARLAARASRALADQPPFILRARDGDVGRHLAGRSARIDVEVGEVQRPALMTGPLHQTRTVDHRATQPIHLCHQQSGRLPAAYRLQGGLRPAQPGDSLAKPARDPPPGATIEA